MLLKEFKNHFNHQLSNSYPQTEIDTFFYLLLEVRFNIQRIQIALHPKTELTKDQLFFLNTSLERLKEQEPVQYILGQTEFYGLPFKVTKDTLIPRPETEELVAWMIEEISSSTNKKTLSILDIGTGSGCIPISLAKNLPNATISSIDVSKNALKIAKENAILNNVNINFIEQDILNTSKLPQQYDFIVSNPPYVRNLEKKEIQPNVLENEPHLALFVDNDNPLIFYKKIAKLAKNHLTKNGKLFFEINQYLEEETIILLNKLGYKTELKKDIFGNDRMIKSRL